MGRKPRHAALAVYLNGRRCGLLLRRTDGATSFQYDGSWLDWEHCFPISLSLPLRSEHQSGPQVLAVFDNLLPDNDGLRRTVAERMGAQGADPYSLLAVIGRDCVGALQFLPEGSDPGDPFAIESEPADEDRIRDILVNLDRNPLGMGEDQAFRISVAGAQEKTALLRRDGGWHIPHGLTATTHILKTRMGRLQNGIDMSTSLENELLCLRVARAFGFDVNDAWIESFGDVDALVVLRFDRVISRERRLRLPQEDFCQSLGVASSRKYEQDGGPGIADCLDLLLGSSQAGRDRETFFAAQLLFWMLGATDGHAKNFSFFLGPGGYRMTPLYDILSADPALASNQIRRQQMQLAMAVRGRTRHYRIDQVHPRHFVETARASGLGDTLIERAFARFREAGTEVFDRAAADLPSNFPDQVRDAVLGNALRRYDAIAAYDPGI